MTPLLDAGTTGRAERRCAVNDVTVEARPCTLDRSEASAAG